MFKRRQRSEDGDADAPVTKKRVNIIYTIDTLKSITWGVLIAGVVVGAGLAAAGKIEAALTVIIASINGAVGLANLAGSYGKDLIQLENAPFDSAKAAYEKEFAQIDSNERIAIREIEAKQEARKLEHEHRNADNEFRLKALEAASARALPAP